MRAGENQLRCSRKLRQVVGANGSDGDAPRFIASTVVPARPDGDQKEHIMRQISRAMTVSAALLLLAGTARAQGAKPLTKCAADAVVSGTVCIDKFEASVWRVPLPLTANKGLVKKIQLGKATTADLAKGGATALGVTGDDYAPCADNGQNCTNDIYAISLPGVTPSAYVTWFQAQSACENSRKRLPSNAEWQAAVAGTPDPGPDDGVTDCNTQNAFARTPTGSRSSCKSARGVFDMVGNLDEWTADWLPRATICGAWSADISPTADRQCIGGAATTAEPGVVTRGGYFNQVGGDAGPFMVSAGVQPSQSADAFGFRCAR
jgi:hypothetical protein